MSITNGVIYTISKTCKLHRFCCQEVRWNRWNHWTPDSVYPDYSPIVEYRVSLKRFQLGFNIFLNVEWISMDFLKYGMDFLKCGVDTHSLPRIYNMYMIISWNQMKSYEIIWNQMKKDEKRWRKNEKGWILSRVQIFSHFLFWCFSIAEYHLTKLITNDHFLEDLTNRYMIGKCMFLLSYFQRYFRLCYQPCVFS